MQDIIEQIETLDLKATEWRVAMRLLHQADAQGRVQLSREACILLCGVAVWGAASRLLCKLAGYGLIGWYSNANQVSVYFCGWSAGRAEMARPPELPPMPPAQAGVDLVQALTELTRQNGALLALLAELTRQIGALVAGRSAMEPMPTVGDAPNRRETRQIGASPAVEPVPLPIETRQNGASGAPNRRETRQNGADRPTEPAADDYAARQNGAKRAESARETRQNGAFSHTCARTRGLSVCLSNSIPTDLDLAFTDRQTDLNTGSLAREAVGVVAENATTSPVQEQPIPPLSAAPPLPGVEPALALGLLRERVVNLPLPDAQAVAYAYPFWQIRDCVFHYLVGRADGKFHSPRVMLPWLAKWDEWMIPPVDDDDRQSELFQRYLLPAERQAQEAEAAALDVDVVSVGEPAEQEPAFVPMASAAEVEIWQAVVDTVRMSLPLISQRSLNERSVRLVSVIGDTWTIQAAEWVQLRLGRKFERAVQGERPMARLQWAGEVRGE